MAALVYDASLDDDPELLEAVRAAAAIALENERLRAESEARLAELQASRARIVAAGDAERRRLERDLHDGAQQRLVALALQLRLVAGRHPPRPGGGGGSSSTTASAELADVAAGAARARPRASTRRCSSTGCASRSTRWRRASPVPTAVACERARRLPRPVELAAYFVASEALANVGKYARGEAASSAPVAHARTAWRSRSPTTASAARTPRAARACAGSPTASRRSDGRLRVSSPPGEGTVVHAELPCGS